MRWKVEALVKQLHVQWVEAETAEEAWKKAEFSEETCQDAWHDVEMYGDPEEDEE